MNILNTAIVVCTFLAIAYSGGSSLTEITEKRINSTISFSSTNENIPSILIHFVQGNKRPYYFLGNGALIRFDKVLTTYNVVKAYEKNPVRANLLVYFASSSTGKDIGVVKRIYRKRGSDLAIAVLDKNLSLALFVQDYYWIYRYDDIDRDKQVGISGWRFQDSSKAFSKRTKNACSLLFCRQRKYLQLKQISFHHFSYAMSISSDKFIDTQNDITFEDDGGPLTVDDKIIGIASYTENAYIKLSSYEKFIRLATYIYL